MGNAIKKPMPKPDSTAAYHRRGDHCDIASRQMRGLTFRPETDNIPAGYPTDSLMAKYPRGYTLLEKG